MKKSIKLEYRIKIANEITLQLIEDEALSKKEKDKLRKKEKKLWAGMANIASCVGESVCLNTPGWNDLQLDYGELLGDYFTIDQIEAFRMVR